MKMKGIDSAFYQEHMRSERKKEKESGRYDFKEEELIYSKGC